MLNKKSFLLFILPLIGILIPLVVVEGVVRIGELVSRNAQKSWSDRPQIYFQAQESATLQDYHYAPLKKGDQEGVFRIAVIGDSFSFAPFMQFTDAFPKVLERMLNLNDSALKVEVVNYGVPAYSTSHEVAVARKAVKEGADLLILQFTLNDPEIKPIRPSGITQFGTWGPYQPNGWLKTLFHYWHTGFIVAQRLHNAQTKSAYVEYFLDLFNNSKSYSLFKDSVVRISNIAKRRSVPLVGVVFPLFGTPLDDTYPFMSCHEKIASLLKNLNLPLLDLLNIYKGIPLERLQVIPGEDRHPNEIGHRLAAEAIYKYLAESALIPEEIKIKKWSTQRHNIYPTAPE
jgi:lysophospholipase L1-like esterase